MRKKYIHYIVIIIIALSVIFSCYLYINPLDPRAENNLIDLGQVGAEVFENGTIVLAWTRPGSTSIDDIKAVISPTLSGFNYEDFYEINPDPDSGHMDIRIPPGDIQEWDNLYFRIGYIDNSTGSERIWWSRIIHYPLGNGISPMAGGVTLGAEPTFTWNEAEGASRYSFQASKSPESLESAEIAGWNEPIYSPGYLFPLSAGDTVYWRTRVEERSDEYNVYHLWSEVYSFTYKSALEIGDLYAGGIVFYLGAGSSMCVSLYDLNSETDVIHWGPEGNDINGDNAGAAPELTGRGDGQANTDAILAALGDNNGVIYPAKICDDLDLFGYTDWYLPSRDDLGAVWSGITYEAGRFSDGYYWTSSEADADHSHVVDLARKDTYHTVSDWLKGYSANVRAVRDFSY